MIELLILYIISNREKTIYSIRKEIIEIFGSFTKPSLGTIYPALKRMFSKKYVQVNERISEGGKKSSYYLMTDTGKKYFRELFLEDLSENPSLFFSQLNAKFATMGLLPLEDKRNFLSEIIKNIELHIFGLENKVKDEFIPFDNYQKRLLKFAISEAQNLKTFAEKLNELS